MNFLPGYIKNYLIVVNSSDYLQQLYKMCMEKVKDGGCVVLLTSQHYDFSKLIIELFINKDELKNFIIMYYKKIDDVSRKLLLLHSWSLVPSTVVVDLSHLLHMELETGPSGFIMQKVALCAVSLLAYLQSIALKLPRVLQSGNPEKLINGLLILRSGGENFGSTQIQTLKDLYFYQTDMYKNFDGVATLLQAEGQVQ